MKITTRVCDICYCRGSFNEQETLHECGELGDLCGDHFKLVYNYITDLKKEKKGEDTAAEIITANGVDEKTGEEVVVGFTPLVAAAQETSNPNYEKLSKKKLPWL